MTEPSKIENLKYDDLVGGDISNVRNSKGIATVLSSSKPFENMVAEPEQFQTRATNADSSVRAPIALPCPDTPRIEVDMRCLDDVRVIELIEDPDDETRTKLAVFDRGTISVVEAVDYRGQVFVPKRRVADGLEDVLLPCAPHAYGSTEELFFRIINLLDKCVAIRDAYRERSSGGSLLLLDLETIARIHKLRKDHEVHWTESEDLKSKISKCKVCDRMRTPTSTKRTK